MRVLMMLIGLLYLESGLAQNKLIKQGHRGCRGLMPENTIEAMKKAIDLGVDVLELDVVISKDKKVVVSHDTYMSAEFSTKPSGDSVSVAEQYNIILYRMKYAEIKQYDVGSKHNIRFPEQENFKTYKPLLSALIDSSDAYARSRGVNLPSYNIEIKSEPETDRTYHPEPDEFVKLVMRICNARNMNDRVTIQSFDIRPLQIIHKKYPAVKLSLLVENGRTIEENLNELGFTPDIYSPYYKTVDAETVKYCHGKGMKIIPWTINTKEEINKFASIGVDGIITDYPNLF